MLDMAKKHEKKFTGSTSSLTSVLSHIYFHLSSFKPVDTSTLSKAFANKVRFFPSLHLTHPISPNIHKIRISQRASPLRGI